MSRLHAALRDGRTARGAFLFLGSPDAAEIFGHAGFDALVIDHEHSPGGLETAIHQMRAIRAAGDATLLVRLGGLDGAEIKRVLDCGAEGLLLPNAESAEQAREFVAACRYPPRGKRGAHFTVSRAAAWGARAADYRDAEASLLLVAMIESVAGVEAIPEMAKVEGLSMFFMGPLDLTGSAGRMGEWEHPEMRALLRRAEQAAMQTGLPTGTALIPGESAADCFARGLRFATVGSDAGVLRQGAASLLA